LKILYYNWIYYPHPLAGGRTRICKYYAERMAKRGHFVGIYTSKYNGCKSIGIADNYVIFRFSPSISSRKIVNIFKRIPATIIDYFWIKRLVKSFDIFHVHAPTYGISPMNLKGWCLGKRNSNIKTFVTIHGFNKKLVKNIKIDIKYSDVIIVLNNFLKEKISSLANDKPIYVLPNGLDLNIFNPDKYPFKKNIFTILYVGGKIKYKGYEVFLKVLDILRKRSFKINFIALGPGLLKVRYEEMPKYYARSSVLICPSLREGMPLSILEAMAMKIPVIATNIGGISEIVRNYVNGILIEPGNPYKLAEAIIMLMRDIDLYKRLAENARKFIEENYNIDKIVEKLERIYKKYAGV